MKRKLVPVALLLFSIVVASGLGYRAHNANADVAGVLLPAGTITMDSRDPVGSDPVAITIPLDGDLTADVTIGVLGFDLNDNVSGVLRIVSCLPLPTCTEVGDSTTSDASPLVVTSDGKTQITIDISLTCPTVDASITVFAYTGDGTDLQQKTVNCTAPEPTGEVLVGGQVAATATPNLLPCTGGTSVITAEVVDEHGHVLPDSGFRFETTAGNLVQTSDDTAKLTLGPNQTKATVTAKIFDPKNPTDANDDTVKSADVVVSLVCNDFATVVVTASPNVIDCTGTTTLTASVRDKNGHVVPGTGFHFVTSTGLLTVSPNNASTEEGSATLTLRPGDGDATVIVSVGTVVGTYEELSAESQFTANGEIGFVTVRQNCLSTTTGIIKVNSSQKNVVCGEDVFIGLSVIDEDVQTVVDETPLTLIATRGGFYGGGDTTLEAAQVPTSHGEANTIFKAPTDYNGEVRITAASGDAYGYTTLNVSGCGTVTPPNTGDGTSAAPCVPIGDGVCITAPNTGTGNLIKPPNTGDAGLK